MATWNDAFNLTPAGSDDPGEGDDRIRELKTEIDGRANQEHVWHDTATTGASVHRAGSARGYYQAAEPTVRPDGTTSLGASDTARFWFDSDDDTWKGIWTGAAWVLPSISVTNVTAAGTLDVTGNTTLGGTCDITGNSTVGGTFDVTGNMTAGGTLDVTGALTAASASITAGFSPLTDQGGGSGLQVKVIEIGDWNMDTTASVTVTHGVTQSKIRGFSCFIRLNGGAMIFPASYSAGTGTPGCDLYQGASSSVITLTRLAGGAFDATDFNSTSFNRGWVIIWYTV